MWFERLTGFKEESPKQVRNNIQIKGNKLISLVNGSEYIFGELNTPLLEELRTQSKPLDKYNSEISVSEIVGNVQTFHQEKENNGAFFQAASQFNLLEMVSPRVTPEKGVAIYENDLTQGPACAVACGAGTIYRNYFASVNGRTGQSADNQIDCLKDIGIELGNTESQLWEMSNGYALANYGGLQIISKKLNAFTKPEYEYLMGKLRIGLQTDTEVTIGENKNIVTQAYCSALPVAYSDVPAEHWEDFARLILNATYESTFYAALANFEKTNNNNVYLTLVGGGVFGNKGEWIFDAIRRSVNKFRKTPLNIKIVSYSSSNFYVQTFINSLATR